MTITDCKKLVQHLLFSSKEDRFSEEEILEKFEYLVKLSRESNNNGIDLYRILIVEDENKLNDFELNSTSKKISSCLSIGDEMPHVVWHKDELKTLTPMLFKFSVPPERILLDIDTILPELEDKLKNVLNHKIFSKSGDAVSIGKAIELYKESDENEVIAQLGNLKYSHVTLGKPFSFFAGKIIAKAFDERKMDFVYKDNVFEWLDTLKPIMNKEEFENASKWANDVYLNDVGLPQSPSTKKKVLIKQKRA